MTWQQILKAITPQNVDEFYEDLEDIFGIYGIQNFFTYEIEKLFNELKTLYETDGITSNESLQKFDTLASKILQELSNLYNTNKTEIERAGYSLDEFNKLLNDMSSRIMTADFIVDRNNPKIGAAGDALAFYRGKDDATNVNLFNDNFRSEYNKKLITGTLSHEFGHQASRNLNYPYRGEVPAGDTITEEFIAYTSMYPHAPNLAKINTLLHSDVKAKAKVNKRTMKMYMAMKAALERDAPELIAAHGDRLL